MLDRTQTFQGDWLAEVSHPWIDQPLKPSMTGNSPRRQWTTGGVLNTLLAIMIGIAIIAFSPAISSDTVVSASLVKTSSSPSAESPKKPQHKIPTNVIPTNVLNAYLAAGKEYHLPWQLLAAIGYSESDHGRYPGVLTGVNSIGCCAGMMQLCVVASCGDAASYYAIDGDNNGVFDIYDPEDAVFTAANLLQQTSQQYGFVANATLLAAYNAGAGAVIQYDGVPPYPETEAYVAQSLAYIKRLNSF